MKTKISILFLLPLFLTSCSMNSTDPSSITLSERIIPDPDTRSVSQEMANSMSSFRPPTWESILDHPTTTQEWKDRVKLEDDVVAVKTQNLADNWGVLIDKKEIDGVTVRYVTPAKVDEDFKNTYFVHIHGGALVFGEGKAGAFEAVLIANYLKIPVISIDYRMPPDFLYPTGLEDVVVAYKGIMKEHPEHRLLMGGTSGGGGFTLSTILLLKQRDIELPDALFLGTPASDVNKIGDSYYLNEGIDRSLLTLDGLAAAAVKLYANGEDLNNPIISPIYGDFSNFPPSFLLSGTRDLFLSNTVRTETKLRDAGIPTKLIVLESQSHSDYMIVHNTPESQGAFRDLAIFFKKYSPGLTP